MQGFNALIGLGYFLTNRCTIGSVLFAEVIAENGKFSGHAILQGFNALISLGYFLTNRFITFRGFIIFRGCRLSSHGGINRSVNDIICRNTAYQTN